MYKELSGSKHYDDSSLSFKFEFKSPIRRRDLASKISKVLDKNIKWFKGVNEDFKPTPDVFKLSNKYSENSKFFVFETGFIKYHEAMHMMLKTMNLINSFGYTDDRCEVDVKIALNEKGFSKLNKFKYLLGLNENKILNEWGNGSNERIKVNLSEDFKIYSRDPYNTFITTTSVERMDPTTFLFPKSDFFGTDFSGLNEGYVTIRYIGGKDYQKRKKEATDTINHVISRLNETIKNNFEYDIDEKRKIEKLVENYKKIVANTKNYVNFKNNYPDIKLYFDLSKNQYLLESNYQLFRNKILELILYGGITEAKINFDNEKKKIQVKEAKIKKNVPLKDFEFYECILEADMENCLLDSCTVKNSKISNCIITSSNYIKNSKVLECKYTGDNNEISHSYIDNDPNEMVNANVKSCLVNKATFKLGAYIDKDTVILNK